MNGAATLQPAQIDDPLNDVAHGASLGWSTWFALLRHCGVERRHEVRDACSWALSGELRRIAHGLLRQRQVSAARFEADATSIVATEFVTLMDEAAEGRLDEVDLPRALLARRSGRAFAVLLSSELGVYPAAGMDGVRRRKAVLASARAALARELGREPTANQVLEAANARMASRADAAKQGMVFTSADLAPVREAEALPAPGDRAWGVAPAGEDACPLEPVMRKQLARLVLEHEWSSADETSRRVARYLWEPQLLDAPPPPQTIRDLRADLPRFNARKAGALFARFRRELPRRLLAEHFGVAVSA